MDRDSIKAEIVAIAQRIPCELCEFKGGQNIDADGGCRHRPRNDRAFYISILNRIARVLTGETISTPEDERWRVMPLDLWALPWPNPPHPRLPLASDT